ncbi:MAG: hypothetical protein F6K26_52920, partial [Moorea sp. SIO2I5]|nr:hypothetical protein [Moorena sp. SIO2I5]
MAKGHAKRPDRSLCLGGKPPRNLAMQRGLGGFPHERLHQDKVLWQQPILHHC